VRVAVSLISPQAAPDGGEEEEDEEAGGVGPLETAAGKVYVQHLVRRRAAATWRLLERGAHVYVCGDAKNMARDVMEALVDVCAARGRMSKRRAAEFVKKLETQKRYQADVWS